MADEAWIIDKKASRVRVRTVAEGMLARLAKDLEIDFPIESASLRAEGDATKVELRFSIDRARVVGVVHGEGVDEGALSAGDRADIVKKLAEHVGAKKSDDAITVRADTKDGESATLVVELPCGRTTRTAKIQSSRNEAAAKASGSVTLSLRALGVQPVKGPMGAFRLSDDVKVDFEIAFTR